MNLKASNLKELAYEVGFDLCGITTPEVLPEAKEHFIKWLKHNFHGEMSWLERNVERRTDPNLLLPGIKSVIILGLNYYQPNSREIPKGHGRVSRYARGRDYHKVIRRHTERLLYKIEENLPKNHDHQLKWWVDYGPFMERAYAQKAGLGYIGKNSMLINKQFGSWLFLSEIVTTLELEPDAPTDLEHGRCGTCRLCLEACPTGAIVAPRVLDSNKCISYLTIERPKKIDEALKQKIGHLIFGCDICQEVCPHNLGHQQLTKHNDFLPEKGCGEFIEAQAVLDIETKEQFVKKFAGTPLIRPKLENLQRNAKIVLENEER